MDKAIVEDRLASYFEEVSHINNGISEEKQRYEEQITLVEKLTEDKDCPPLSESDKEILSGEHAFYRGQYKIALKHYLAAKESPHCQFCCLRASAYVLYQQGKVEKARSYAKRALAMRPDDAMMLLLTGKLIPSVRSTVTSPQLEKKIADLAASVENQKETKKTNSSTQQERSLREEEVNALEDLFNKEEVAMGATDATSSLVRLDGREMEDTVTKNIEKAATEVAEKQTKEEKQLTPLESSSMAESLEKLVAGSYEVKNKDADRYLNQMGLGLDTEDELQKSLEAYQEKKRDLIAEYTKASRLSKACENGLTLLSGWSEKEPESKGGELLASSTRQATGGFFVRWRGKGIAVNPGPRFLHNFHDAGLHIRDIDYVVVTRASREAFADTKAIYDLNYQLNMTAANDDLHIIHYYLNTRAHRDLAAKLKPNFKQERNTVHSLELYVDSPDVEKIDLCDEIKLHYFLCSVGDVEAKGGGSHCLGLKIECLPEKDSGCGSVIGHVSGTAWSPLLSHNLGRCDVLIAGFEKTSSKDFRKIKHNEDSLGYFGCYTLMEEVAPRVLLCTEFEGREGDIRLEATRKMRHEYAYSNQHGTSILPGEKGFFLNLQTMQVRCSVSCKATDPSQVRVIKGTEAFGALQYLSPSCFL